MHSNPWFYFYFFLLQRIKRQKSWSIYDSLSLTATYLYMHACFQMRILFVSRHVACVINANWRKKRFQKRERVREKESNTESDTQLAGTSYMHTFPNQKTKRFSFFIQKINFLKKLTYMKQRNFKALCFRRCWWIATLVSLCKLANTQNLNKIFEIIFLISTDVNTHIYNIYILVACRRIQWRRARGTHMPWLRSLPLNQ